VCILTISLDSSCCCCCRCMLSLLHSLGSLL
jgi:hypothetical protein